jgi:hypothetical protein
MNNFKKAVIVTILTLIACFINGITFILTAALAMKIGMINAAFWVIMFASAVYFSTTLWKSIRITNGKIKR